MKKFISVLLIAILTFSIMVSSSIVFAASNIGIQTNSDHTSGRVNQSNDIVISVGSKVQLYAFIMEGVEVTGDPLSGVTWSTSNVQVVAISANGLITALKEGTATITASFDGGSDTIKVTVGSGTASNDEPTSGGSNNGGSTGGSGSGSGTAENNGISWPDLSGAKFTMTKEQSVFLEIKLRITNISTSAINSFISANRGNASSAEIVAYISNDSSPLNWENPSKPREDSRFRKELGENLQFPVITSTTLLDNNMMSIYIDENELYARKGDFYGSLYAICSKDGVTYTKALTSPAKIVKPAVEAWGNRMKFSFYDNDTYVAVNEPTSYAQQTGNLTIGQITDDKILDNFRKNTSDRFEKLVEYASAKNNSIADLKLDFSKRNGSGGTNQIIETMNAKGLNLKNDAFYYVYSTLDGNNGKYNQITDVDICIATVLDNGKKSLTSTKDFGVGSNTGDGNAVLNGNLTKDPTTSNGKLPQTGIGNATTAGIVATIILTIISYVVYSRNKDIR